MTANDPTPDGGKNLPNSTETKANDRDLTIETVDGDLAAVVTITGMGHDTSAVIVDRIEAGIRSEVDHLVCESE